MPEVIALDASSSSGRVLFVTPPVALTDEGDLRKADTSPPTTALRISWSADEQRACLMEYDDADGDGDGWHGRPRYPVRPPASALLAAGSSSDVSSTWTPSIARAAAGVGSAYNCRDIDVPRACPLASPPSFHLAFCAASLLLIRLPPSSKFRPLQTPFLLPTPSAPGCH
ncbi:hypothetical protein B0H19DRAFT_1247312 [Mycena capillaripes]|nr:hypothetical protein B0H19DRAFT_1247312 [Mycena capillaripes]